MDVDQDTPWPVVVIDDDEPAREPVVRHLEKLNPGSPVLIASDEDEACRVLAHPPVNPVLALLDLVVRGRRGVRREPAVTARTSVVRAELPLGPAPVRSVRP